MAFPDGRATGSRGFENVQKGSMLQGFSPERMPPDMTDNTLLTMTEIYFHDLRGSLTSILATLKLLTRGYYGTVDEKIKTVLDELFRKGKGLMEMTEEHLSTVFSFRGDLRNKMETLNLEEDILHPVLEELDYEMRGRGVRIDNRCHEQPIPRLVIRGGKLWFRAVFRNLLKNAISYGDLGGTIVIRFEPHGTMYLLSVYNSGNPIPQEGRERLFRTRYADQPGRLEEGSGLGIGLYLSRLIVRSHGGDIWYEAKEHGSNFVLALPFEAMDEHPLILSQDGKTESVGGEILPR